MAHKLTIPTGKRLSIPASKRLGMEGNSIAPWTPASASGLVGWWDASRTDQVTLSGSEITQVNDLSGNANHLTQSTSDNRPLVGSINGMQAADVTDTTDRFSDATFSMPATCAIVFLFKPMTASGAVANGILAWNASSGTDFQFARGTASANQCKPRLSHGSGGNPTVTTNINGLATIIAGIFDPVANTVTLSINGGAETVTVSGDYGATDPAMTGSGTLIYGSNRTQGTSVQGEHGELVIVSDITTANIEKIEGYLAHKWCIASTLAAAHPYKTNRPT